MSDPLLSIIVPSYNHSKFLIERLASIYNQSYDSIELIILDDASQDRSVEVIRDFLEGKPYTLIINSTNSGSPFKQWEAGIRLAKGKYAWIAESDDICNNTFLASLLPQLENGEAALAYTRTLSIDEDGYESGNAYWPDRFSSDFFSSNQLLTCNKFLSDFMCARNCIPNVSSAVFTIQGVKQQILAAARSVAHYKFVGDWIFWGNLLRIYNNKKILYVSRPISYHRDHATTTRAVCDRRRERYRIAEYSAAINQLMSMQGLLAPLNTVRALKSRWWDWSYEQYFSQYKPHWGERLTGYPQSGLHLFGYWTYQLRRIGKRTLSYRMGP